MLMQIQADMINRPVVRPLCIETTALGAAYLAGLATGFWDSVEDIKQNWQIEREFESGISEEDRRAALDGWHHAVRQAMAK
jgi:glycerol kinase